MDWDKTLQWLTGAINIDAWVMQVFVIVLVTLIIDFMQKRMLRHLLKRAEKSVNLWDDALIEALPQPLNLLIWVVGLTFAADIIHSDTETGLFSAAPALRSVGVIASIIWFLTRVVRIIEKNVLTKDEPQVQRMDESTVVAISKLVRLSILITGALVMLQTLGFSISGLLAFGGVGGIAVGFAARDLLANFFGGLMIYLDRPFTVGDWVRSPDRDIEGTVEDIGWRLTRIRTFDRRPLYVPNSVFTNIAVENPSRMSNRRIYETIGIRYEDAGSMDKIVTGVVEMLKAHKEIDSSRTLIVNFNSFAPSSLDFFVYTFTKTTDWVKFHAIKQDVLLKILDIIESHGAQAAFPTSTLHIDSLPSTPSSEHDATPRRPNDQ